MSLLRKIGRTAVVKLADGRKRATDRFEVRSDAASVANIDTLVFLAQKTPHEIYTTCLLDSQQILNASADQSVKQELVRVYFEPGPDGATPRAIYGTTKLLFPFAREDDLVTAEIQQDFISDKSSYTPPALSGAYANEAILDPQPAGPLYLMGDYGHRDAGGDSVAFTRIWSMIPAPRIVPFGSYAYQFPGLQTGGVAGVDQLVTAITPEDGELAYIALPVLTIATHPYDVGDVLVVRLQWSAGYTFRLATVVAITTNTVTLNGLVQFVGHDGDQDLGTFTAGATSYTRLFTATREPTVYPTTAQVSWSYALPGVTAGVDDAADFREADTFRALDILQAETDTLNADSIPTADEYRELVKDGEYLTAESAVRPYRASQFLVRRDLLIRAK